MEIVKTTNVTDIFEINMQDKARKKELYRNIELELYGQALHEMLDRVRYMYGLGIENIKIVTES
jgi:hypothetical protein